MLFGPALPAQLDSYFTPLLICCVEQLWGAMPNLLKAGADPNVRLVSDGVLHPRRTSHLTARHQQTGAHALRCHCPHVQRPGGMAPLHFACEAGQLPAVRALVAAGARVNALARYTASRLRDSSQVEVQASPLACALRSGHVDVASFLLGRGADPNLGDESQPVRSAARAPLRFILLLPHTATERGGNGAREAGCLLRWRDERSATPHGSEPCVCILHQWNGPPPASCRKDQQRGR